MKTCATLALLVLTACGGGSDRHQLEYLRGRLYEDGVTSTNRPLTLRIDEEPIDGQRLSGTLYLDSPTREWGVVAYADPDHDGYIVLEYYDTGTGRAIWSWLEVLDGGAWLENAIETVAGGWFPQQPPAAGLAFANLMGARFRQN